MQVEPAGKVSQCQPLPAHSCFSPLTVRVTDIFLTGFLSQARDRARRMARVRTAPAAWHLVMAILAVATRPFCFVRITAAAAVSSPPILRFCFS